MQSFRVGILAVVLAVGVLLGGCSSSNPQDFVQNPSPVTVEDRIGSLHLGAPTRQVGLKVEGYDAQGRLVSSTTTDERGSFLLRDVPFDGRVVLHTEDVTLSAQVNGQRFLWVTGVSTLMSRYLQAHPEVSAEHAQERIARFLDISEVAGVRGTFGESWRSEFSWSALVERAGSTPLNDYLDQLVEAASVGQIAYFRQPHPYPALKSALGHRLHPGNIPAGTQILGEVLAQEGEVAASFLKTLVDNVAADVIANEASDGLGKAFGWLGSLLGLNKAVEIAELQTALRDLLNDVENLSIEVQSDIEQEEFDDIRNALNPALIRIGQQSLNYLSLVNLNPPYLPDTPVVSIDPTITEFATGLRTYADDPTDSLKDDLDLLRRYLQGKGGTQNAIFHYASLLQNQNGNLTPSGSALFQDLRSNELQEKITRVLDYYRAYQVLGINLLAENAHMDSSTLGLSNTQGTNTIASGISTASTQIAEVVADLAIEGQLVPPPTLFSDDVFVDRHTGAMWAFPLQPEQFVTFADSFQLAGVDEYSWYLPTTSQLSGLRGYALNAGGQNVLNGLQAMGFTGLPSSGDIYVACSSDGNPYSGAFDNKGDLHLYDLTTGTESTYEDSGNAPEYLVLLVRNSPGYTTTVAGPYSELASYQADTLGNLQAVLPFTLLYDEAVPSLLQATWSYQVLVGYYTFLVEGQGNTHTESFNVSDDQLTLPPSWSVSSDTPGAVSISNVPEDRGAISYLRPGQSFDSNDQGVASVITSSSGSPQGSTTLSTTTSMIPFFQLPPFPSPSPSFTAPVAKLTSILVTPTNRVFEENLPPGGSLNVNFFATGFYDNGTVEDLTFKVTWSVAQGQSTGTGSAVFNPNGFATTVNQLRMPQSLNGTELTITASYQDPNTVGVTSGSAAAETDF